MTATTEDLPVYPPARQRKRPFDPPVEVLEIQASEAPVRRVRIWDGSPAWLVTGYANVRAVLSNDASISADPSKPGFPEKSAAYKSTIGQDENLRTLDNPEHDAQKRMVIADFTAKAVAKYRPRIQEKVDALLDDMLAGDMSADIVTDLAFPVPTMVICELLGIPYEDRDYFGERSNTCFSSVASAEEAAQAGKDLYDYLDKMVDDKLAHPGDDLMSRMAVDRLKSGELTRRQVVDMARIMLIAGHETTANMISLSTLALLRNPEQLDDLKANLDDRAYVANAVNELLRYVSVAHTGRRRAAIADIEVGGVSIPAGEGVIVANNVADRDPDMFPDPHTLNLRRENANATLAFGYGIHQCIGQTLSRVELQVVHSRLWRRVPNLELAIPFEDVRWKEDGSVYGLHALPVNCWKTS